MEASGNLEPISNQAPEGKRAPEVLVEGNRAIIAELGKRRNLSLEFLKKSLLKKKGFQAKIEEAFKGAPEEQLAMAADKIRSMKLPGKAPLYAQTRPEQKKDRSTILNEDIHTMQFGVFEVEERDADVKELAEELGMGKLEIKGGDSLVLSPCVITRYAVKATERGSRNEASPSLNGEIVQLVFAVARIRKQVSHGRKFEKSLSITAREATVRLWAGETEKILAIEEKEKMGRARSARGREAKSMRSAVPTPMGGDRGKGPLRITRRNPMMARKKR